MVSILKSMTKQETIVAVFKPEEFEIIGNERFAKENNVVMLAKQAAGNDLPAESAKRLDANELSFKKKLDERSTQAAMRVNQMRGDLKNLIQEIDISKEVAVVEQLGNTYAEDMQAEFGPDLVELIELRGSATEVEDEIIEFKRAHGIQHSANYKESNWSTIGILLIAIVFESMFNSFLFAQGSDFGLVGGVVQAAAISLMNVVLGFMIGFWVLRYKNHNISKIANTGLVIFLIMVAILVIVNLGVGHYREGLLVDPDNAAALALESLMSGMTSFSDIQSWFLALVGAVAFSVAIYEGYSKDDPYPGYGKLARKHISKHDDFLAYKDDCLEKLDEFSNVYHEKLSNTVAEIDSKKNRLNNYLSTFREQKELLIAYMDDLSSVGEYAITLYRDTNSATRSEPPPAYFDEKIEIEFKAKPDEIEVTDNSSLLSREAEKAGAMVPGLERKFIEVRDDFRVRIAKVVEK